MWFRSEPSTDWALSPEIATPAGKLIRADFWIMTGDTRTISINAAPVRAGNAATSGAQGT